MVAINPVQELAKLRDHLSSADKLVTLLFGAGTSAGVAGLDGHPMVPAVDALTAHCQSEVDAMGAPFDAAWTSIADSFADKPTIEDILSLVRQMRAAISGSDTLHGLTGTQVDDLERIIRKAISSKVRIDPSRLPDTLPHTSLARWAQRIDRNHAVDIFTTNYDTLFERAFEMMAVPVFDGFVGAYEPFFFPASLRFSDASPAASWTRLWKIHGSVTWTTKSRTTGGVDVIRGRESELGEMILPSSQKYDESRKQPYVAMLDRLRDVLAKREDGILIAVGYSFSDQHINEVILEAVAHNPRLHVFALCYADPAETSHLYKAATSHSNIVVLAPTYAIVGGVKGNWKVSSFRDFSKQLAGIFVPPKGMTEKDFDPLKGAMTIGDFNVFCKLLDQVMLEP